MATHLARCVLGAWHAVQMQRISIRMLHCPQMLRLLWHAWQDEQGLTCCRLPQPAALSSAPAPPCRQVSSFNVVKNEVCSLNNSMEATPARAGGAGARCAPVLPYTWASSSRALACGRQLLALSGVTYAHVCNAPALLTLPSCHALLLLCAGLIGTAVYGGPASDPASPRIVKQASGAAAAAAAAPAPVAASNPTSTNAPFAWPAMDASTAGTARAAGAAPAAPTQAPQHTRSATVVGPGAGSSGAAAAGGAAAGRPAPSSGDYLAALDSAATNPFETPALWQQEQQHEAAAAAAKAAAKQELLQQVGGWRGGIGYW